MVIGGGYIGCELAQMFARAGARVTLVTRSRLLPEAEPEVSEALTGYLRDEGITVRTGLGYRRIDRKAEGIALTVDVDGTTDVVVAEHVLLTTGRTPNTAGLGLKEAGIDLTQIGRAHV